MTPTVLVRHPPDDRIFRSRLNPRMVIGKPGPRRERPDGPESGKIGAARAGSADIVRAKTHISLGFCWNYCRRPVYPPRATGVDWPHLAPLDMVPGGGIIIIQHHRTQQPVGQGFFTPRNSRKTESYSVKLLRGDVHLQSGTVGADRVPQGRWFKRAAVLTMFWLPSGSLHSRKPHMVRPMLYRPSSRALRLFSGCPDGQTLLNCLSKAIRGVRLL